MDIVKRRLTSIPDWMISITPLRVEEKPVERVSGKILRITEVEVEKHFDIRWHDIDSNQHVNNTKYVEWLMESVPTPILNRGTLKSIDIVFKNESVLGDKITTQSQGIDKGFIHRIINQNGQELVTGETVWENNVGGIIPNL
jgi:acyl-ACP thioesterase